MTLTERLAGADGRTGAAGRWLAVHGPVTAALVLGAIALAESWIHAVDAVAPDPNRPLLVAIIVLLGLASTVPVALAGTRPMLATGLVTGTLLLSIVAAETLTFAGAAAQLITAYRLGSRGLAPLDPVTADRASQAPHADSSGNSSGGRGPGSRVSRLSALLFAAPFPLLALIALTGSVSETQPVDGPATVTVESTVDARGFVVPLALLAVLAPIAALAGIARRSAREAAAGRTATAAIADSLLEHTARGERARIARELHDVVAHHISMVAVQAETARLTTPGMPEAGAQRLRAIGDTARSALTEMRRLLGVLREDTGTDTATLAPQPGLRLRELNALIDSARDASGTSARLVLSGRPVDLDPGVELVGYRIIQEALTNARRHAPGAAVDVTLAYTPEELVVTIRDNGPGADTTAGPGRTGKRERGNGTGGRSREATPSRDGQNPAGTPELGSGHGLTGMRERAAAVGAGLLVGAAPGGGFRVELRLPVADEAAT